MKIDNKQIRKIIYKKFNGHCAYCGCELNNFQIDHIIPLKRHIKKSKTELNTIDNFNPVCKSCNASKSTLSLEKWRKEIRLKLKRIYRDNSIYRILLRFGLIEKKDIEVIFYFEKFNK
jgi:5-methylcytosine-specific restriction endonuclease McrA